MKKIKDFITAHKILVTCLAVLVIAVISVLLLGPIGIWYDLIIAAIIGICLTNLKEHSLFKVLTLLILIIVLISNILVGRQNVINRIGAADVLVDYFSIVLQNFSYILLYVFAVGGFYGVISKTASYKKFVDNIVTKVKPLGKKFIFITIILFAVIASLTGITLPLFIFIPLIVSIILLLGYDKLVAFSATFASIIIGYIGGIFINFVNPNTYKITTYDEFVGLANKFTNVFPKLLLLFASIALLIYFVDKHIKNVEAKKVKYDLNENEELLIAEVKGDYKDIKTWPLIVVMLFIFVILVLGMIPWTGLFEIEVFTKFHEWLLGLTIKDLPIIPSIISSDLPALGEWTASGNFMAIYVYSSMLIVFATLVLAAINKVKVNEMLSNFMEGMKKLLPAAFLITIAFTVLVCAYNNGFYEVVISNYGKFNFGVSSLLAFFGSILNVDTTWITIGVYAPIIELITDESIYSAVSVMLQGIYGLFLLVGPTSLILIVGLSYLDIPYTTWLKYIWRFILALIILLAVVVLLVTIL